MLAGSPALVYSMTLTVKALLVLLPAVVIISGGLWLVAITTGDPTSSSIAQLLPWPVACSSRGCITTTAWGRQTAAVRTFAEAAGIEAASPAETLTTLVRQHLVEQSQLQAPVTLADARRYREEILHLRQEETIGAATGLGQTDYDRYILIPYLAQESLRQERESESFEALFSELAQERAIVMLPLNFGWDASSGRVVQK